MSAEEHDPNDPHHDDNYERAYAQTEEAPLPATPAHGYWRSLAELEGQAAFQQHPALAANELPPAPDVVDPMSRRNFFQLMGASMALAGVATGCRYEKEEIVPLARRPEDMVPGTTQQYATAFELGGAGHALLATSFEGRPIKLDGNPEHPFASGSIVPSTGAPQPHAGCSTFAQASILHLYDPDRSQTPLQGGSGSSIDGVRAAVAEMAKNPRGLHILSEATSSPTLRRLQRELVSKGIGWHEYEPISWDNERLGMRLAFESAVRPIAKLDQAHTIVTLDCDVFVEHPAAMRYSRDFAKSRRLGGSLKLDGAGKPRMNRLWTIESTFSHTGAMADHRLALRSDLGLPVAMALDAALGGGSPPPKSKFLSEPRVKQFLDVLIEELTQNRGKAVVIAGRRQPPEVHALVARINERIAAVGNTLEYVPDPDLDRPSHLESIKQLAGLMGQGRVESLIILGGNPVYDAPADLDFAGALAKVKTSLHLSDYVDETSQKTTWHVPRAHFLEAWGDVRTWDGTITLAQPLISPLYGGISAIELLAMVGGEERHGQELVRATHDALGIGGSWRKHVHDGFISAAPVTANATTRKFPLPELSPGQTESTSPATPDLEVTFHYSAFSYDGRYANNAWLQETPDFLTKVTWDNYALVGPETAQALGIDNDRMITVKLGDREVELACHTIPGQARYSIALVLGGGRRAAGRVGGQDGVRVGWDTYKVRTTTGFDIAHGATVTTSGDRYTLASTQEHWDIRTLPYGPGPVVSVNTEGLQERLPLLIKEITAADLVKQPTWVAETGQDAYWDDAHVRPEGKRRAMSLFQEKHYSGRRWAMAIDLTTCTGCNACMVACQNENNVPVVGRKEVISNREMHWIRIDRYFSGPPDDPVVVHQPVACQQCELAPCETVCPVGATVHSDEGLNDQAYNRCIGTRYCANNCPYKVRRFNFLDWNKEWREARNKVRRLLFNPDVTVRMRGVMEKCTFCVQRIEHAKIHHRAVARQEGTNVDAALPDGAIVTACQQACPTEAIVFGDLSDPNSRVSRAHADQRHYDLLPEMYTKPRNKYLARVRNPHPKLAPAKSDAHGGH